MRISGGWIEAWILVVFFSFLLPRAIARFIRVASRILPRIYFNGVARSRLRGFLRGHVERRVLISAARQSSFASRTRYTIEYYYREIARLLNYSRRIAPSLSMWQTNHSSMSTCGHGKIGALINERTREPAEHSSANISHVAPINDWRRLSTSCI